MTPGPRDDRMLIIDDEESILALLHRVALDCGFDVRTTADWRTFLAEAEAWRPTHIVLDLQMPEADGIQLLRELALRRVDSGILIVSGLDSRLREAASRLATERGLRVVGSLAKPFRVWEARECFRSMRAPEQRYLSREVLQQAVERREFVLHYQPKVSIVGDLVGLEALLRWNRPGEGLMLPETFLPLAEALRLVGPITTAVIGWALRDHTGWRREGCTFPVAVNVSALDLCEPKFADAVLASCRKAGVDPGLLTLEVTETAAMADPLEAMDSLTRLRLKGIRLAMDDFGTGHTSLSQLKRLPFSELKIDRSIVAECAVSEDVRAMTKALVGLGHTLKLAVVAEGVETEAALRALRDMGCDSIQGYLIGKPMSASEVPRWAARWHDDILRRGFPAAVLEDATEPGPVGS